MKTSDDWTKEDWKEAFEERAAIMEFEGKATRKNAEVQARRYWKEKWNQYKQEKQNENNDCKKE